MASSADTIVFGLGYERCTCKAGKEFQRFRRKRSLTLHGSLNKVDDFLKLGVLKSFTFVFESFGDVDGHVLHTFVGFFGTADEEKILAFGEVFVPILVIQADSDQADGFDGFFFGFASQSLLRS